MPVYAYRAVDPRGHIRRGEMSVANENALSSILASDGMELLTSRLRHNSQQPTIRPRYIGRRVSFERLAGFSRQMTVLLQAGISFPDALDDLATYDDADYFQQALRDISQHIRHGKSIVASFALYPLIFPQVYLALLASGAASGKLAETFAIVTRYAEERAQLREKLTTALRYPIFMGVIALAATLFTITSVLPSLADFITGIGGKPPFLTLSLLWLSHILNTQFWPIFLTLISISVLCFYSLRHSSSAKMKLSTFVLRLPLVGKQIHAIEVAHFTQALALLLKSGVSLPEAMTHSIQTVQNVSLSAHLGNARTAIVAGQSPSMALATLLNPVDRRLLRTGEQSGTLIGSLETIAAYDRQAALQQADTIAQSLGPILTSIIGLVLIFIVIAVLGPLYGNMATIAALGTP